MDNRIAETERALAYSRGQLDALRDRALADKDLREAVRIALWASTQPGSVSGHYAGGEAVLQAPPGLPDGMTEDDLNAAVLARVGFEDGGDG